MHHNLHNTISGAHECAAAYCVLSGRGERIARLFKLFCRYVWKLTHVAVGQMQQLQRAVILFLRR